jgi:hypothetical protein
MADTPPSPKPSSDYASAREVMLALGKVVWSALAIFMALVHSSAAPGWFVLLIVVHLAWFLTLIWSNKNG